MVPHLLLIRRVHVHDHGFQQLPAFSQQFEERPDAVPGVTASHPQHPFAPRVDDDSRVPVPLMKSELVHGDHLDPGQVHRLQTLRKGGLVDRLDLVPGQAEEGRRMLERKELTQASHAFRKAFCDAGIPRQPRQFLQARTTTGT